MTPESIATGTSKTKAVVKQVTPFPDLLQRIRALAHVLESEDDKKQTHVRMYNLHEYIIMNEDALTTAFKTPAFVETITEDDINNGGNNNSTLLLNTAKEALLEGNNRYIDGIMLLAAQATLMNGATSNTSNDTSNTSNTSNYESAHTSPYRYQFLISALKVIEICSNWCKLRSTFGCKIVDLMSKEIGIIARTVTDIIININNNSNNIISNNANAMNEPSIIPSLLSLSSSSSSSSSYLIYGNIDPKLILHQLDTLAIGMTHEKPQLNIMHALVLRLGIKCHMFKFCYQRIKADYEILEINPIETGIVPLDLLSYFYGAGNICMALNEYNDAKFYYLECLHFPAYKLVDIMINAYKKCCLLELIITGQPFKLPSFASIAMQKFADKNDSLTAYDNITKIVKTGNINNLKSEIKNFQDVFTTDDNLNLIALMPGAMTRHRITKLTSTYVTLSLPDIAKEVGLSSSEEAEREILQMISSGYLQATIDQSSGMVYFLDNNDSGEPIGAGDQQVELMNYYLSQTMAMTDKVRKLQSSVMGSKAYVSARLPNSNEY